MTTETLGDALPELMARIRDEMLPEYDAIGPAGAIGAALIRADLDRATRALSEGDVVAMMKAYQSLKSYKL